MNYEHNLLEAHYQILNSKMKSAPTAQIARLNSPGCKGVKCITRAKPGMNGSYTIYY